jgi:hypothetical protein
MKFVNSEVPSGLLTGIPLDATNNVRRVNNA